MTATGNPRAQVEYEIALTEVDRTNVDQLANDVRRFLHELDGEPDVFVLECGRVRFIDSSAIAALIRLHRRLDATGGRLEVRNAVPAVYRAIEVLGLADRLHVVPSRS
jgi:anti-anti-sigma factor